MNLKRTIKGTICLSAGMLFLLVGSVWAGTINVDVNDPACVSGSGQPDPYSIVYCNIQDAIDDATSGDVINVAAGTYAGFTVATANIELRGAQYNIDPAGATTRGGAGDIDESLITSTIMITADYVTVNGFKTGYPINVGYDHAWYVNISYNISLNADGHWGAIHLHGIAAGPVYNQCDFAYIGYNTISGTTSPDWQGGGIWTVGNDDVTIEHNHILNSQYMGIMALNHVGDRNQILHNTITGSGHTPIRFWGGSQVDISYNVVDGGGSDGIWVDQAADNSTVSYNQISNVTYAAVALRAGATGVNVHHNTITASGTGIEKHDNDITGITINYNDIYGNSAGFGGGCTAALDVRYNYWGGGGIGAPGEDGNNSCNATADYSPWLGATVGTSPMTWGMDDSIQDAIDVTSAGDVINVAAGTYVEQITIDKSLTLAGAGELATIIQAPPADRPGSVTEGGNIHDYIVAAFPSSGIIDVKVEGFTIDANGENKSSGTDRFVGLFFRDVDGTSAGLFSCTIKDFATTEYESWGVLVYGDANLTIYDNDVSGFTRDGIGAIGDDGAGVDPDVIISDNTVTGSAIPLNGIYVGRGATGTISGNTVKDLTRSSPWAAVGILVYQSDGITVGSGNTVENCWDGIVLLRSDGSTVSGNTLTDNIAFHIGLDESDNNQISGNTITGTVAGTEDKAITLSNGATGNIIGGSTPADANDITLPTSGSGLLYVIYIQSTVGAGSNTVQYNTVGGGTRFVQVDGGNSGTTTVADNTVTGCSFSGVYLNGGSATISGNTLTNTARPVEFWGAVNVTISQNIIDGSTFDGINCGSFTGSVTVSGNAIYNTTGKGIWNRTTTTIDASGNWWGINTSAGVAGEVSAYVDYTPWLDDGTDTEPGTPGFQGDFSVLNVDDDSPQTGSTLRIQEGVDMVTGSTVNVKDGTYGADPTTGRGVYITKDGLSLIGESETGTIIDGAIGGVGSSGSYWPKGIHVQANNVTVQNFTVQGFTGDLVNTGGYGVLHRDYAHDTPGEGYIFYDGCTVDNVTVQNCYSVVYALCFTHLTVLNCNLNNNFSDGMFIARGSDYATIHDNTVTNSGDHGIWVGNCWMGLRPSHDATIYNNTVNGAREGGISFVGSNNAVIHHNSITNAAGDGWSVGALSLKDGPTNVEAHHNTIFNNSGTWNGYNGTGHGVGIDGAASNIDLHHNSIYGNSGLGVYNGSSKGLVGSWERRLSEDGNLPTFDDMVSLGGNKGSKALVLAEQNWWGAYCGPYHPTTNPNGQGDEVSDYVDFEPWCDSTFTECDFSTTPPSIVWVDDGYTPLGANDGHYWCYDAFDKIQDGVDAVAIGGTVNVATGTYEEQVRIDGKGVDLVGTGVGQSIIEAVPVVDRVTYTITQWTGSSRTIDACIGVTDAGTVNVSGFTVDGKELGPDNFYGIHYFNTGGSVTDCRIEDITDAAHPSNSRVVSLVATHGDGETITINFSNNVIPNFQKGGILVMGPGATFTVNGNSVSGVVSSSIAGNCIQLSYGATGTTASNYVEGTAYTGSDWASTGILLFECGDISMDGDSAYNCEKGVNFSDWGWIYNHPVPVNLGFANLVLDNNEWSLGIQLSRDNSDVNMTVTSCDVSNSTGDGIDFYCTGASSYYTGWDNGDLNATVTGSNITGSALDGIWGADYSGNANNVSISVNYCMFSGNVGSAINNDFTQMMDATACYWDDPSGPTIGVKSGATRQVAPAPSPYGDDLPNDGIVVMTEASNAVKGSGETIYGPIDYSPWWGDNYVGDPHADPWTWYVNTSNNSTIQEGIDAASGGDTVRVRPETYVENIVIDKALALLGAGQDSVLVYTDTHDLGADSCSGPSFRGSQMVVVQAADVFISGFTFNGDNPSIVGNPDARNGIICDYYTSNPNNLVVRDCTVKNVFLRGIYGTGMGHITGIEFIHNNVDSVLGCQAGQASAIMLYNATGDVDSNTVTNSHMGCFLHQSSDGNIRYNDITDCDLGCGVNSNYALTTFSHNTITRSGDWGAIQVVHQHGPVNIHNNTITDAPWGPSVFAGSAGNVCDFQNNTIYGPATKNFQPRSTRTDSDPQKVPQDSREGILVENPPVGAKYGDVGIFLTTESVFGDGPVHATITGNEVAGYNYNVICHERAGNPSQLLDVNANGSTAPNLFYGYGTYAWYMENCNDDIDAQYNYWDKSLVSQIEDAVFHQVDDPALGLVDFSQPYLLGDVNLDRVIDLGDVVYLINYLYKNGPAPYIQILGDVNRDEITDIGDVIFLINYLYRGGPPPVPAPRVARPDGQKQKLSPPTPCGAPLK